MINIHLGDLKKTVIIYTKIHMKEPHANLTDGFHLTLFLGRQTHEVTSVIVVDEATEQREHTARQAWI